MTLQFNITQDHPPVTPDDIVWTFNGTKLNFNNSSRLTFSADRRSLTISRLNLSDEGFFTMTASNPAGSDTASIFVDVEGNI